MSLSSSASCKLCMQLISNYFQKNFPDHSPCLPLVGATDRNAPKYILLVKSVLRCLKVLEEPQFYFSGESIHFYLYVLGCFKGTVQIKNKLLPFTHFHVKPVWISCNTRKLFCYFPCYESIWWPQLSFVSIYFYCEEKQQLNSSFCA